MSSLLQYDIGQTRMHRPGIANFHIGPALHRDHAPAQRRLADTARGALAAGVRLAPQALAIDEQRYRVAHLKTDRSVRFVNGGGVRQGRRDLIDNDPVGLLLTRRGGTGAGQTDQLLLPWGDSRHRWAADNLALGLVLVVEFALAPGEHPNLQVGRGVAAVFQP
ncbi:hypothetical protein D9M71_639960 [compost metagenome]